MRVWIVNPFDPIPGDAIQPVRYLYVCQALLSAGHEVTWWSSNFFHLQKVKRANGYEQRSPEKDFRIVLLPTPPYKKNVSLRRLYNHAVFARQFDRASRSEPIPDLILASFPPIGSAWKAVLYGLEKKTRVVLDVQDLWPEAFEMVFPRWLRGPVYYFLAPVRRIVQQAFAHADGIMGVSQTYVNYGLQQTGRHVPSLMMPLGVDLEAFDGGEADPVPEATRRERSAIYIGTVGLSYDVRTVLEAASIMRERGDPILFHIAGGGPQLHHFRLVAKRMALGNVVFHDQVPYHELTSLLRRSMVGIYPVVHGAPQTLTNKLFYYLAAGLPILNSSPGEAADLLREQGIGISYPIGDAAAFCQGLDTLLGDRIQWTGMSARARGLAVARYDKRRIYQKTVSFFEQVCAG